MDNKLNQESCFKAFIRVIKSLDHSYSSEHTSQLFTIDVVREPLIIAENKQEVKQILLERYPQFFQNGKIYEKETKDQSQFFYVLIFPLYSWEIKLIESGEWTCSSCGQVHENKYHSPPKLNERLFGSDIMFCKSDDDICLNNYWKEQNKNIELPDQEIYIKKDSPTYIYKCTEKSTGKCYIGKTRNAPFFRWWNHLTHSSSPFGIYLRKTKISDWTFEVIEILHPDVLDSEVFRIESEYILKFNSLHNGFNQTISNKKALTDSGTLFDEVSE